MSTRNAARAAAIQKYRRGDFVQTSYDELYSGHGGCQLLLRQYPLISVESVRYRPVMTRPALRPRHQQRRLRRQRDDHRRVAVLPMPERCQP